MSELIQLIQGRRSVRKYLDTDVTEEQVRTLLESVRWAPSWANTQCWEIIVVRDSEQKKKLQDTLPPKGNPAHSAMVAAPVVLAVCGKLKASGYYKDVVTTKFGDWFLFDLGIATQNICLTAYSLGLGTVIVGLFDHDRAKNALGVPEGYEVPVMIPVGVPAKISSAPKRREVAEFLHKERF
jgi:nitroreductase